MGHPGFCGDEIDLLQMPVTPFGVDHLQALLDLEEARPAGDATTSRAVSGSSPRATHSAEA